MTKNVANTCLNQEKVVTKLAAKVHYEPYNQRFPKKSISLGDKSFIIAWLTGHSYREVQF